MAATMSEMAPDRAHFLDIGLRSAILFLFGFIYSSLSSRSSVQILCSTLSRPENGVLE
jgi:hypothetical protein